MKRAVAAVILASAVMLSTGSGASAAGSIPVPNNGAYLGIFVRNQSGRASPETFTSMTNQFEANMRAATGVNRVIALHLHFGTSSLAGVGSDASIADDFAKGRTPVLTWKCPGSLSQIASGAYDQQVIIPTARAIAALPHPIMLRWFHEFNLNINGARANAQPRECFDAGASEAAQAQDFIAAWRHIHDVFVQQGAGPKVTWIWCPAATPRNLQRHDVMAFFPGRQYVDWIGGDFYDRKRQGFAAVAQPFYSMVESAQPGMPIIVDETGEEAANGPPFTQARYMEDIAATLPTRFPAIKALIYFNAPGNKPNNWVLTPDGEAAFARLAANPYFRAMP